MHGEGNFDGVTSERRVEFRVRKNGKKERVEVERSAAEGLPEGWIKELVISRKARKLRKDRFFIDPKSGYIFFSMKDASRYVRTGVIGNLARKPKENSHNEDDSGNGKTLSPSGSSEERSPKNLLEKEKKINFYVRNSKRKSIASLDEHSENGKRSFKPSTSVSLVLQEEVKKKEQQDSTGRELVPFGENDIAIPNEQCFEKRVTRSQAKAKKNDDINGFGIKTPSSLNATSGNCDVSSKLKSVGSRSPEERLGKKEKAQDSTERKPVSRCEKDVTNTPVKQAVERRVTRSQAKVMSSDDNCELERKTELSDCLPQRVSKRLAGIELEPTPELKTRTKAWQAPVAEQSDDARAGKCKELVLIGEPAPESCKMTVTHLSQAATKHHKEHSSPKQKAAFSYCKKTEMPLVSEKDAQLVDIKPEGHSGEKPKVARGSKNKKMGSPRLSTRGRQTAFAMSEDTANGKCEGASKLIAPADIYKQARETPAGSMLSFEAAATKCGGTGTCRRSGRFRQSKPNAVPVSQTRNEIPLTWNQCEHPSEADSSLACVGPTGNFAIVKGASSALSEPLALDSTLADLWNDPCIAFAIKTLTGESLDPPNTAEGLTEPKKSNAANNHNEEKGVSFFPVMPESSNMSNQIPGRSTELGVTDIWKDPCIDFAIKTLTGAIPIGFDEPECQSQSQLTTAGAASTQVPGVSQIDRDRDRFHQHCNSKHKTMSGGACLTRQVGTSANLRFSPSFSKGYN